MCPERAGCDQDAEAAEVGLRIRNIPGGRKVTGDMRVLAVCGSLKGTSGNLALLKTAAASMPPGVDVVFFDGLGDLPHFNPDLEANGVTRERGAMEACAC